MGSMKKVCTELDSVVVEFFSVMDEIYQCQSQMESLMKDGFLFMSKARYTMGAKRVTTLQVPETDMGTSSCHVHTVQAADGSYTFQTENLEEMLKNMHLDSSETTVRKRTMQTELTNDNDDTEMLRQTNGVIPDETGEHSTPTNPLNWFGVLVPQALRQSQDKFKNAALLSCTLATLMSRLQALKNSFRTLSKEKALILASDSSTIPDQVGPVDVENSEASDS